MGLFDDPSLQLDRRTFSYALGPFYDQPDSLEEFPPPISKLSLFVDKGGKINISNRVRLYDQVDERTGEASNTDPLDCIESVPTFSKGNKFVRGLASALEAKIGAPTYSVVGIPTYDPADPLSSFPAIPDGWVIASGYRLVYDAPEGVVVVPDLNTNAATTGVAYIFKVERMDWARVESIVGGVEIGNDVPTTVPGYAAPIIV
jgi:hypothetical protein